MSARSPTSPSDEWRGPRLRRIGARLACLAVLVLALILGALGRVAVAADGAAADGAASAWFETEQGAVRLIAASNAADGEVLHLGLEFRMAPGWKIYWRSPGDAGYPPAIDWAGSENLAEAHFLWPAPKRFTLFGVDTVGYEEQVVLPIDARLAAPGATTLRANVDYLTCNEICVPYQAALALDLPAGPAAASEHAARIEQWRGLVPEGQGGARIEAATVLLGSAPALELHLAADTPFTAPDAFVEGPDGVAFGRPKVELDKRGSTALLRLPIFGDAAALTGRDVTVTAVDGARLAERTMPVAIAPAAGIGALLPMLALALVGGFILNFMPCVLPVLSMKLVGVIDHAGRSRRAVRLGFLATAAGILFSFGVLAAAMIALKAAGVAVGWGVQFQQPLFLAAMVALLVLFALNLFGLFEVPLPGWLAGVASGEGALAGNFATGAFATLLATPCSAPFLGTAVGFALAAGPREILAIFLLLGVGLALPYLAVAAVPGLASLLPRPGRWMLWLRRVLGFLLGATAFWLLAVLAAQIGVAAALAVGVLMAGAAAILVFVRVSPGRRAALAAVLLGTFLVPAVAPMNAPNGAAISGEWQPFERDAIESLVREGKTVFVDVTADWCLTCQVNKRLVLDTEPVREALTGAGVVAMRADWTRPDEAIAQYLRSFGRYGIPFNAVYGPGAPGGEALPELLTQGDVLAALKRAAGAKKPPPGDRTIVRGSAAAPGEGT